MLLIRYIITAFVALSINTNLYKGVNGLRYLYRNSEKTKNRRTSEQSSEKLISDDKDLESTASDLPVVIFDKEDNKFEAAESHLKIFDLSVNNAGAQRPIVTSSLIRVRRSEPSECKCKGSKSSKGLCNAKKCAKKRPRKKGRRIKKEGRKKNKVKKRKNKKNRKKRRKGKRNKTSKKKSLKISSSINNSTLYSNGTLTTSKKEINEICVSSRECADDACCARHGNTRICLRIPKLNETCEHPDLKHKRHTLNHYELCPCEKDLVCLKVQSRHLLSKCMKPVT